MDGTYYGASQSEEGKETTIGQMCMTFWRRLEEFEIAHLSTSDGIGIELFSFLKEQEAP
jgi:hypothetical protein